MAVKGATAKVAVIEKIKQVFGEDFIGVSDGKVYVMADDGTEKVHRKGTNCHWHDLS